MKSEERHKLQQNELADYLAKAMERTKPYQNAILGGIILILVVILLVHWWNGKSATEQEVADAEIYRTLSVAMTTGDPTDLVAVADKYPDSPLALSGALTAADIYLNDACNLLFVNKLKANSDLESAVTLYTKLLPNVRDPFLKAKATFGLARAEECQNQLPKAKTHYQEIVSKWPDGPYGVLASRRLADIERPATKEMYDKFANYNPKPFKDDSGILDKMQLSEPSGVPEEPLFKTDTLGEKMNLPDAKKDAINADDLLKDKSPPAGEQPATEEKKADETKPADAGQPTPEPAKPAEGEKPATEPPAATPPAADAPAPTENGK
jgi:hypothetical protein